MRIRGSGSGFSSFGDDSRRSDDFKKGRRPGQKVRGRLIKKVTENTAWVDIEGHKLLASIRTDAPEGTHLSFIIKQLTPTIILKAVFEPSGTGMNALSLASNFDTARTLFENRLRPYAKQLSRTNSCERKKGFIELLSSDNDLLSAYLDATNCLSIINNALDKSFGRLAYMPWLVPSARRLITLTAGTKEFLETTIEFDLPQLGMVRTIFLAKEEATGYRLLLQRKRNGNELKRYLTTRDRSFLAGNVRCLEVGRLPPQSHGGIITELMFKQ